MRKKRRSRAEAGVAGFVHLHVSKERFRSMPKSKGASVKPPVFPPPHPYIIIYIDQPQQGQTISIPYTAKGRTAFGNGAAIQWMKRQVNRFSDPPLTGQPKAINAPYANWSTVLDGTDCPGPGSYEMVVSALDGTSGLVFSTAVDFIVT